MVVFCKTLQPLFCKGCRGLPESPDLTPVHLSRDQIEPVSNGLIGSRSVWPPLQMSAGVVSRETERDMTVVFAIVGEPIRDTPT
jgi:hypothetical protein